MAVALVTNSYTSITTNVSTQTWSFNAGASTSNTILIVSFAMDQGTVISGVTYNGVALTQATGSPYQHWERAGVWYLLMPATGTNNLVVSYSSQAGTVGGIGAVVFSGVNQTTPLGTAVTAQAASNVSASVTVPSNGAAVDILAAYSSNISGPTQTQLFIQNSGSVYSASQYSITSGSKTFGWTCPNADLLIYPINPGTPVTVSISHGAVSSAGEQLHLNEALVIAHAALSLAAEALHVNEALAIAHAALAFTGKSLTSVGNTVVSIAHGVMGLTGKNLSAALGAIKAIYLNVWSMLTPNPRSRGM